MNSTTNKNSFQIIRLLTLNLIFLLMIRSFSVYAQKNLDSASSKKALSVNIENITIHSDSKIHGLIPNFPYPVLSAITVFDSTGNFVTDLADTSRWLGPEDVAQIGLPISEIWNPIVEYHAENPAIPGDPDLYHQIPAPIFKEIVQDMHIPTSTMLVMDVSTSMTYKLEDAKEGARLYVEQLRPVDRAGIILFNHEVVKIQKFTSDKNLLFQTIDSAKTDFGTAINDALMASIQETKYEKTRPRIIVYTDGRDNNSEHTPTAIIDSARVYQIPIYTISLGDYTIQDTLKQIADSTGGLFFKVDSSNQMANIYQQLSDLIQHFYLMAHTSPDPLRNNTWRTVDVTVNLPKTFGNYQLRGLGKYFVEGVIPADLSVSLTSITDATIMIGNDTLNAVLPGDIYQYQIQVKNSGPNQANYVKISHIIPDSVHYIDSSVQPFIIKDSLIVWQFNNFEANDEMNLMVSVQLPPKISKDLHELFSSVELIADNDYNPGNNSDEDTVRVFFPQPVPKYDLSISQTASTDSIAVVGDDTIQVVVNGETVDYTLEIKNSGPSTAHDFKVINIIPDSMKILDFSMKPTKQIADSLFWQFDSLPVGKISTISLHAGVADSIPVDLFPLTNISQVIAENDTFKQNNIATTTVYAVLRPGEQQLEYDLSISQMAITDSIIVIGSDSFQVVLTGDTIKYVLTVNNLGPDTARNFNVWNVLPDSVSIFDFSLSPNQQIADTLYWRFDTLAPGDILSVTLHAVAADTFINYPFPLTNMSGVSAKDDTFDQNNIATTTVYAISRSIDQPLTKVDISVSQYALTDSISVVENDTMRFARPGEIYSYIVTVTNNGLETAQSVRLVDQLPDSVSAVNYQLLPNMITKDSLAWELGDLSALSSISLKFDVMVSANMPIGTNLLINKAIARATNEDSEFLFNNTSIDTVYNVVKPSGDLFPIIAANPPVVDIGDEISVRVQVVYPIESWDIWVYLADGSIDYNYADEFVSNNKLEPNTWYNIDEKYKNTKLFTAAEQEQIIFELRTIDIFGKARTAQAVVTVTSNNAFHLDRNVFEAHRLETLGIHFKLSSNRVACLDLFDVSGKKITNLNEQPYQAGWNTFHWNGTLESGLRIGSGLYLITLKSGNYNEIKKVMIVQ